MRGIAMKTTKYLGLFCLFVLGARDWPGGAADSARDDVYDWGVAYFMSYDNDLEIHGEPIIDRIARGVRAENTVAAVQADFKDSGGMHRVVIRGSGVSRTRI